MVLKVYGHPLSPGSKLVVVICYEMQVPFEFITLNLGEGESKNPEHLEKNPWGKIPVIDDDGFILYESRAISYYIAEKYAAKGPRLVPSDIHKRALLQQAISSEICYWNSPALPLLYETYAKKFFEQKPDPTKVEELTKPLASNLDVYEKILAKQKYVAGDDITVVDFHFLPMGTIFQEFDIRVIQERPNVARWFNDIASRPSWKKVQNGVIV